MRRLRWLGFLAALTLVLTALTSCGEEGEQRTQERPGEPPAPPPAAPTAVPEWAKVAPEQIAEAARLGVPVAFENGFGMRFVLIPGGKYLMGSPEDEKDRLDDEGPQHEVTVSPFYLAVTEVTNAQYRRFKVDHDSGEYRGRDFDGVDQPVVEVSHEDATAFVRWLSEQEGGAAYRLPSEAEWEYACRAGTTTRFWSGDTEEDLARVGWCFRNSGAQFLPRDTEWDILKVVGEWACHSHPVGEKPANPWGLHDMHGNVWEWCEDTWHDSYEEAPFDGSAWVEGVSRLRVYRGGSWVFTASMARSANRGSDNPWHRIHDLGVRPARAVTPE